MKKTLTAVLCISALVPAFPSSGKTVLPDWQNPEVVERNRAPMTATFNTDGMKLSLDGIWKFNWNETIDERPLDFWAAGYDDSSWGTMPVPGMWELNEIGRAHV